MRRAAALLAAIPLFAACAFRTGGLGAAGAGGGGVGGAGGAGSSTSSGSSTGSSSGAPVADACPGLPIALDSESVVIMDSTKGAADDFQISTSTGCAGGPSHGPDLVYAVTPARNGTLSAVLVTAVVDAILEARMSCDDHYPMIACDAGALPGSLNITFEVAAGLTYYVIVDSLAGGAGDFSLSLTLL